MLPMSTPTSKLRSEKSPLIVRPAEPEDITLCCQLNGAYQTDYVWQMYLQEGEQTVQITFNRVRLPRTMAVAYPYSEDDLRLMFEQAPYLFVASYEDEIMGCIDGILEVGRRSLDINNLIVHRQVRRQGIGRLLLKAVRTLALQSNCRYLTITVQTKNYPAIEFFRKIGFVYCGYNDKYYNNGDIALVFSLKL